MAEELYTIPMVSVRLLSYNIDTPSVEMIAPNGMVCIVPLEKIKTIHNNGGGKLYEVTLNSSLQPIEAMLSEISVDSVFPSVTGYVLYFDSKFKYYHIYDNLSRHFVARGDCTMHLNIGDFVRFSPVIPNNSKFKSAIVTSLLEREAGINSFGTFDIEILEVDLEKSMYKYRVINELPELDEGWFREISFSFLDEQLIRNIHPGDRKKVIMFLKRAKDNEKYNYIAEILN